MEAASYWLAIYTLRVQKLKDARNATESCGNVLFTIPQNLLIVPPRLEAIRDDSNHVAGG